MQRSQDPYSIQGRVRQTLRSTLLVAGHLSEQAVRRALGTIRDHLDEDGLLRRKGRSVVEKLAKSADKVIEKSPVPIPQPVQEAMSRMQDGLGQLSHAHQDLADIAAWDLHAPKGALHTDRRDKKKKHLRHDKQNRAETHFSHEPN